MQHRGCCAGGGGRGKGLSQWPEILGLCGRKLEVMFSFVKELMFKSGIPKKRSLYMLLAYVHC